MKKTKRTKRKFSHHKIKLTEIEAIEREWAMRYNSEIPNGNKRCINNTNKIRLSLDNNTVTNK